MEVTVLSWKRKKNKKENRSNIKQLRGKGENLGYLNTEDPPPLNNKN